jgi:hypothetical protein
MDNPIKKHIQHSIIEILLHLPQGNSFLVENVSTPISGYFIQALYEALKNQRSVNDLPVLRNLEEIEPAVFFPKVTEQLADIIATSYPELQPVLARESRAIDIVDFVYLTNKLIEKSIQNNLPDSKPLQIVFILYNADVLDGFGQKFKEDLNDLLKENIFSAVIVAKHLISRKWESHAPHWLEPFRNLWLV